ncbi:MAG: glycosyltransferase, partial [Enterococcus sp.]|nr:glycosyltransferase [Enterococcus sp.]
KPRDLIKKYIKAKPTFLSVGTLEPRKNYLQTLQAFKQLQKGCTDFQLLIIGKNGWSNFKELKLIEELDNSVLWVQDASDAELSWAYKNCEALIMASVDEGYGIPLIEAAHFSLPVICSDIPIFHEVMGGNASYFKLNDVDSLANILIKWEHLKCKSKVDAKIKINTWQDCARAIYNKLAET